MITVACVLRSGGIYDPRWVLRLQRNVARFAPPHRFVCLSDVPIAGVDVVPLIRDWPGWWSKVELWHPGIFGSSRVLYLDLDNVVVGDLTPLFAGKGFVVGDDTWEASKGRPGGISSAVMAWDAGDTELWDKFEFRAERLMERLRGDQDWIAEVRPHCATFAPGFAVSYKADCRRRGVPKGARIISCHGKPKPPNIGEKWFREIWAEDGGWRGGRSARI